MKNKIYEPIISHYESCFKRHGDSHLGVDWPNHQDAEVRYKVMLEGANFIRYDASAKLQLLDFGCGAAHLCEYIKANNIDWVEYSGLDISEEYISFCRKKYDDIKFYNLDILEDPASLSSHDYVVMNGVFTEKRDLHFSDMWDYFKKLLKMAFSRCTYGLAFNVMSKHVDWEREDLFHLPHDELAAFLTKYLTRNYIIRNDYGLYEYTVYIYK